MILDYASVCAHVGPPSFGIGKDTEVQPSDAMCLRCANVPLRRLPESASDVTFLECPTCNRQYAVGPGQSLHDRWRFPISIPLYSVIFEANPVEASERVAAELRGAKSREFLRILIDDIEDESRRPTQRVCEILEDGAADNARETVLRQFLVAVAAHLRTYLDTTSP